jgi:hypothetical protein
LYTPVCKTLLDKWSLLILMFTTTVFSCQIIFQVSFNEAVFRCVIPERVLCTQKAEMQLCSNFMLMYRQVSCHYKNSFNSFMCGVVHDYMYMKYLKLLSSYQMLWLSG